MALQREAPRDRFVVRGGNLTLDAAVGAGRPAGGPDPRGDPPLARGEMNEGAVETAPSFTTATLICV